MTDPCMAAQPQAGTTGQEEGNEERPDKQINAEAYLESDRWIKEKTD